MARKFETIAIAGWALVNRRGARVPWSTQLLDHDPSNTPESAHDVSRKSADAAHPDMAPHRWQAMCAVPGDDGFEQAEGKSLQSMQQQLDELLAALRRLSFAAMSRDNTMGDPSSMLAAKAELSDANKQAMQAINNVTGVNHENSQR